MPGNDTSRDLPLFVGLFAINVFWGGSFVAVAVALRSVSPFEIAALRFFIAVPLLVAATLLWKGPGIFRIDKGDVPRLVGMAITGVTLQYVLQVSAQSYTTAINASLLINTSTFFILFLSATFLGERLSAARIIGAFIGFGGVALLVSGGTLAFSLGKVGDVMIIACAFLWAIYSILSKRIANKYHALTALNWAFILGAIGLVPFYFLTPHVSLTSVPWPALASIGFLAVFCSIVAYLIYNVALETMDASRVALFIYLVPLATIVLAWLILGERLSPLGAFGGLLVLAGMWIAERKTA